MEKTDRIKFIVYFILATLISLFFRGTNLSYLESFKLPYGTYYGMNLLVGIGPLTSAIICRFLFKENDSSLRFFGTSVFKSTLFLLVPIITVIYLGVINKESYDVHLFALKVCFMWLLYIFGEEYGWRGYLQRFVVKSGNDYKRSFVIGITWYLWHISFFELDYSFIKELFFIAILIFGSFLILKVTKRTGSFATAVALHFSFSVLTNIRLPENSYPAIICMCICWIALYIFWNKKIINNIPI